AAGARQPPRRLGAHRLPPREARARRDPPEEEPARRHHDDERRPHERGVPRARAPAARGAPPRRRGLLGTKEMNTRSTIALAAVALALGAFIYFYERHTVGTSEIARREGRVLDVFERAKVDRIELEREGQRLVIVREDGDLPGFRLVEPLETHADEDAVEALLGALDWAVPFRTIHDVSDEDRRSFGLDDPFVRVKLSQGERAVELRIGKEAPGSDGRYAESGRAGRVYVLGADV